MGLNEYFGHNLYPKFSHEVKRQIIEEQDGRCDWCGDKVGWNLEIHHRIPENMWKGRGIVGKDVKANGVALCSNDNRDCHERADKLARRGIVYPNLRIEDMPPETYSRFQPRRRRR